jgi:TonB family protein
MRGLKTLLGAAGLMIFAAMNTFAGDVKIVANPSVKVDTISAAELKRIFLEEQNSIADGTHVEPVLEKNGPAHATFLQDYLGETNEDLQTHYQTLVFTGRGFMPRILRSDAEVVAHVARTRGAIGYVSSAASVAGVKTLAIGVLDSSGERRLITRIEPDYPETLKRLNIGGTVRLRVSISAKGKVESVALLGGNPILGDAAASAVKNWVYASARSQSIAEVSISFDGR